MAGMSGTNLTGNYEFKDIYKATVLLLPSDISNKRKDLRECFYADLLEK